MELLKKIFRNENGPAGREILGDSSQNSESSIDLIQTVAKKFKVRFSDPSLLITALKHRSFLNVNNEPRVNSNERLEFLGDAVLDLVVTHFLYRKFPKRTEGQLSKVKAILVSTPVLAKIAGEISLGELILINWGEEKTGGRQRQSILADGFEALIGAIYLDQGLEAAQNFIQDNLLHNYKQIVRKGLYKNYKSILLEHTQSNGQGVPDYRVLKEIGPDHEKEFIIEVLICGKSMGEGRGHSKKIAEQRAAAQAAKKLGLPTDSIS